MAFKKKIVVDDETIDKPEEVIEKVKKEKVEDIKVDPKKYWLDFYQIMLNNNITRIADVENIISKL